MPNLLLCGEPAPEFELLDIRERTIRLRDYRGQTVLLAFLRGFLWPYCRAQLARLRDDYPEFTRRRAEVLAIGPDGRKAFATYWQVQRLPFPGLPDPDHRVALRYKQEVNLFKLGRMPLVTVVDPDGLIRYAHYGASMSDIPENHTLLEVIDEIKGPSI